MNEFDLRAFIDNLRATKPPYECPFEGCGRVYKSFSGIQAHLVNFKHDDKAEPKFASTSNRPLTRDSLSWLQAQKIVDFDLDGRSMRVNIYEPLEIVSVHDKDLEPDKRSPKEMHMHQKHKEIRPPNSPRNKPPEATFRIIDEFIPKDAPPMPSSYIKFIEKHPDELEEEIEYDMDEEDYVWLSLMNERRLKTGLPRVSENTLELLMDCFEKDSHFQAANAADRRQLFDEDAVCCVCNDGECDNSNAILFCDMCNLAVHQECYGVPYIPEGQWLCRRCQLSPSQAVDCVLCPNRGGAFKQTSDGRWSHVVCALWVPEVQFANTVFLEPIEGFERVPAARWKLTCYVCKQKNVGACIQCHKPSCYTAFHVTCAHSAGLYTKMEPIRDLSPGSGSYTVRKTAFCDAHAPSKGENGDEVDNKAQNHKREESKLKMRKARKLLAQRRNSSPLVSIPVISKSKLDSVSAQLKLAGKQPFLERLLAYWTLKRQSRFGVPLLRRLQVCHQSKRIKDGKSEPSQVTTQVRYWKRLRQDLEKARLLVELLRKREQRKREIIGFAAQFAELLFQPRRRFFSDLLDKLIEQDEADVFAKPVTDDEVPGYSKFVKKPMDFGAMRRKVMSADYFEPADLLEDFDLMISNCLMFNKKTPYFIKYAQKMKRMCAPILKEAETEFEKLKLESPAPSVAHLLRSTETQPSTTAVSAKSTEKIPQPRKRKIVEKTPKETKTPVSSRQTSTKISKSRRAPKIPRRTSPQRTVEDDDARPLSALVIDEQKNLSGELTDDGRTPKSVDAKKRRRKRLTAVKRKSTVKKTTNTQQSVKPPGSPIKMAVNSPKSPKRSDNASKSVAVTRSSFRNFRGDPRSPDFKSEEDSNSSTEKDDTEPETSAKSVHPSVEKSDDFLPLEHMDIVWATVSDYSFPFPGVIIDPRTSSYGSVPNTPKPPENVRKQTFKEFRYLVMLFSENSAWHWLERKCVEPLFVDSSHDRRKLASPSKATDKKKLQKAYDTAVKFRCDNTGEDPQEFCVLAGDSSDGSSSYD